MYKIWTDEDHDTPQLTWPISGYMSSYFGEIRGMGNIHLAIDIDPIGPDRIGDPYKPVAASYKGTIYKMESSPYGYGWYIVIDHGNFYTLYAHLSRFKEGLRMGDKVEQGEYIGNVGATGYTTGPHLHFEVITNESVFSDFDIENFGKCVTILEKEKHDDSFYLNYIRNLLQNLPMRNYKRIDPFDVLP